MYMSHVYRPQFLVLSGTPSSRPDLILFASHLAHETGIMVCGDVIKVSGISYYCCMYVQSWGSIYNSVIG